MRSRRIGPFMLIVVTAMVTCVVTDLLRSGGTNLPWFSRVDLVSPTPASLTPATALTEATPAPTLIPLLAATPVTAGKVYTIATTTGPDLPVGQPINLIQPLRLLTWAPSGDKFLYVTNSGEVFWSDLDGSNAARVDKAAHFIATIEDQMPLSNTLIMRQRHPEDRNRDHIDVVRFASDQLPTVEEVFDAPAAQDLHWWSPTRISGLLTRTYSGGDFLIIMDDHARVIEERNVPYMGTGVVQPGGEWLAYATRAEVPAAAHAESAPQTVYLLNLRTGERRQITAPGQGIAVHHWSPDGRWFLVDKRIGGQLMGAVVSVDGQEQIHLELSAGHNTRSGIWSPDSRYLAYSVTGAEAEEPQAGDGFASRVYVVDLALRTAAKIASPAVMRPSWAPDSRQLALLTFDPTCAPYPCSGTAPAFYLTRR